MNYGELTNDPHQRLVEVLLEQEFAATRAVAPSAPVRSSSRWLAAALVVLGVGAVLGTMTLRRGGEPAMVPMQDPQPAPKEPVTKAPKIVEVARFEDFRALAHEVHRVRLQLMHNTPHGAEPINLSVAVISKTQYVRDFVDAVPPPAPNTAAAPAPSTMSSFRYGQTRAANCPAPPAL